MLLKNQFDTVPGNDRRRVIAAILLSLLFCLLLPACGGDSPWRFTPAAPAIPAGLVATPGNGQASLRWRTADNAAAYNVYYAPSPVSVNGTGTRVATITSTSTIVTGLSNGITYYFVVTAVNSSGESLPSDQVSTIPTAPGSFQQSDLQGTWQFNGLVSGASAGWLRGAAVIDGAGKVSVTTFLDSAGNTAPPADLFTTMTILPDGAVTQSGAAAGFQGVLSANQYKDLLAGSATLSGASRLLVVMQKRVAGISYASSDIKGTGRLVAGPLPFVYHQLASGLNREWEHASGQVGQDQAVTYASITGPTPRQLPGAGNKVTTLAISVDGIVTETPVTGVLPRPAALLTNGVMSADKMTIIGTATDAGGAFVLRIIQFIHPPSISLTAASYTLADLAGAYRLQALVNGAVPQWVSAGLNLDSAGTGFYGSYLDSSGSTTLPASISLTIDQQGMLTRSVDQTYNGQFSYFKDLYVATRTDAPGVYSLGLAVKR